VAEETGHFELRGDPVPDDALVTRYRARELISSPYTVTVDFSTQDLSFEIDSCLRQRVNLEVVDARGNTRWFDGVVDRAEFVDAIGQFLHFRVRFRPALAAMDHRQDSRIFQNEAIIDVIKTLFDEAGFTDKVKWETTLEYEPREYLVQYRESQLNFVHRLFEDHGVFYYFEHDADGHTLFISDDAAMFAAQSETPATLFSMTQGVAPGSEPLQHFHRRRALRTSGVHMLDYDFEKPQAKPAAQQPGADAASAPYFEYGANFKTSAHGSQLASGRMRSLRRDADTVTGKSRAIGLRVGVPFVVAGAAEEELNGGFVVTELTTSGHQHVSAEGSLACENTFKGIPAETPYAPPRTARRPRIHGVQTAIVTGSGTEEQALHVDEYGRIKVRFYWDRVGQQDHTSSCWIRCSQVPLGGSMILPRIGWELPVAFLNGDPDRPVVLGRVYNAEKVPPQGLPAAKASGSLKSWSTPGGAGMNEIGMSDTGGSQGFGMHAQKDLNITIGNDKTEEVAVDEEHMVSVNESLSVGSDETIDIGGNQAIDVGANLNRNIGANQSIDIGGNDTSNATCDFLEQIDGNRDYTIGGKQTIIQNGITTSVEGNVKRDVGSAQLNTSIASIQETVTGDYSHTTGAVTVHLAVGSHGETVGGNKSLTSVAAELHMTKANLEQSCDASVTTLIGGLHYEKLDGDLVIKAPMVSLLGAVGVFSAGGSSLKLGGAPIVIKGKKIASKGALLVKMAGQMKMG